MFRSTSTFMKKFAWKKSLARPVGRWGIGLKETQIERRVKHANEDHCGTCDMGSLFVKEAKGSWLKYIRLMKKRNDCGS